MRSAGICCNHQPPLHRCRDGGRNGFRMAGWPPPAPSNRASGPVRAGKPSRPRSRSLWCVFVFEGQLFSCHRHRRTRSWCSSCSIALADEPLLSSLRKLSPCRFSKMFGPDELAAHVPRGPGLGDAEVLPNTFGLNVAAVGKVL
jgi:hypothetical protein